MIAPSPIVALNRAVAIAEIEGPGAGLAVVESVKLDRYYLFHAIRADLLRRLGDNERAASAYDAALALTSNERERAFLTRARDTLRRVH